LSAAHEENVGGLAGVAAVKVCVTVLLGAWLGATANALTVTGGLPTAPTEIGVKFEYLVELVVGMLPSGV
jgi:hypothetical protein